MRIFSCLVATLALLAGSNASAAVKVLYTVKGKVFEVAAFKDDKLWGRTDTGMDELPDGGTFSLDGSDWMDDARVLLTVKPDVTRRSFPDALEPYPRPFEVGIIINNTIDFSEDAGKHGDMIHLWNLNPDEKTLAILIWQTAGGPPEISHKALLPANFNWYKKVIPMRMAVDQSETVGMAGMLLLGSTGFVAPRPEFADPDAEAALRCLIQNDEAGFGALLDKKKKLAVQKSTIGATLLHYAALFDRGWAIDHLHRSGANLNAPDELGEPPLVWAAELGHALFVEKLLLAGVDPDKGFPLHAAIRHGHEQVTNDLVQGKSDLASYDLLNESPSLVALNCNRGAIAKMLVGKKAEYKAEKILLDEIFCGKIASGQDTLAEIMLAHDISPNCEVQGFTPLMIASLRGDQRLVAVLLKAGAKPNAKGQNGLTPLLAAAESGDLATARELVEAGSDCKVHNDHGATVAHAAAASGKVELLDYLLDHGAPLGEKTKNGATVLSAALLRDHRAAALELQKRGLGLDPKGAAFEAELEAVLRLDLAEVLEPLLRSGWQPDSMMSTDWPVRQVAKLFEAQRCLQLLGKAPDVDNERFIKMASAKSLTKKPILKAVVPLEDPRPEEASLIPGNVDVEFVIDAEGNVVFPRISRVDDDRLREPTLRAIQLFKYHPAYSESGPAALQVKQTLVWRRTIKREFALKDVDEPPVPLQQVSPIYPFDDKKAGTTGTVTVQFVIGVNGRVTDIEVVRSSGKSFTNAVVYAVAQWKFRPGRKGGVPVNVRAAQTIPFSLTNY